MGQYKVGDKVEVTRLVSLDEELGILVGDIGKVVIAEYFGRGDCYIECHNPKWNHPHIKGYREMKESQIRKVGGGDG